MNIWNTCSPGASVLTKNERVNKNIALKRHSKANVSLKLKSLHYSYRESQMQTLRRCIITKASETSVFQVVSFKYYTVLLLLEQKMDLYKMWG